MCNIIRDLVHVVHNVVDGVHHASRDPYREVRGMYCVPFVTLTIILCCLQGDVQQMLIVDDPFAAYEYCTKYSPECDKTLPETQSHEPSYDGEVSFTNLSRLKNNCIVSDISG